MKDIIINILRIFTKLLKYALITVIGLFFISVILLSGTIRDFRAAYLSGLEGKNQLTEAFAQLKSGNYEEALRNSQLANLNFNASLERLNSVQNNIFVKKISLFRTQVNYLEYLFKTTEILSSSLERSIPLVKQLEEISGGKVGNSFANLDNKIKVSFTITL